MAFVAIGVVLLGDGYIPDGEAFIVVGIMFLLIWLILGISTQRREPRESSAAGRNKSPRSKP